MKKAGPLKVTYATAGPTAGDPFQAHFDEAAADLKARCGRVYPMSIGGRPATASHHFADTSPVHTGWTLGYFPKGTRRDVEAAVSAARKAFPAWSGLGWKARLKIMRTAVKLIRERSIEIAAVLTLEVGKNRIEAQAEVQEGADLVGYYCDRMEDNGGFLRVLPAESRRHHNASVLKPFGVWAVISPFNFPFALAGGPSGAALIAGNTVVFKPATDAPLAGFKLTECFLDAGIPEGVFNFVTGAGASVGESLAIHPDVDGFTFTGSYDVGMHLYRVVPRSGCLYPRPHIFELGGKNPAIVSRKADLDAAASGILISAFGFQGQKCSACSRVYVERSVAKPLLERLAALADRIAIGDPSRRGVWFGPVINERAYADYDQYCRELSRRGKILRGGRHLIAGELSEGFFCAPTIVTGLATSHPYWKKELFVPILTVAEVAGLDESMRLANDDCHGLTAGFYSRDAEERRWFFDHIQAGVTYVNRAAGATTGAWPGYQPFGGWKGSGSTGKSSGGPYYLQQYMREQSQTWIELPKSARKKAP
jgi:1-pyrroline-5-carboxylate dehydrogenase